VLFNGLLTTEEMERRKSASPLPSR
jgi:hypothetical protein